MRSTTTYRFETLTVDGPHMYADAWVHDQDKIQQKSRTRWSGSGKEVEAEGGDRVRSHVSFTCSPDCSGHPLHRGLEDARLDVARDVPLILPVLHK